jgi:hypothetical protein
MPSKRIEAALRRMLAPGRDAPEAPAQLESELMTRFEQRADDLRARPQPLWVLGFARAHRFALASVLFLIATIGACYAPADVAVPMGVTVEFQAAEGDPHALVNEIVGYVKDSTRASEVGVQAWKEHDGPLQIRLRVWGEDVPEGLDEELLEAFPQLEQADLSAMPFEGTVRTTLGRRLGHQLLDIALAEDDLETARSHLMAELVAQGISGNVEISISEHNGQKQMRIEVEAHEDGEGAPGTHEGTQQIKMRVKRRELGGDVEVDEEVRVNR